jgi:heterodisulfide reductase subunit D
LQEDRKLLYFVGCLPSYWATEIPNAVVKILKFSNVAFSVLGPDEMCCGAPLLRFGERDYFENLARHNVNMIEKLGAETVVTSCPACYRTLKFEYPELTRRSNFDVKHVSEILFDLIKEDKLKLTNERKLKIAYHDPCELASSKLFEPPREVIRSVPNIDFIKLDREKEETWCCGGGGGVLRSLFPELAFSMGGELVKEAASKGAERLITSCPLCLVHLKQTARKMMSGLKVEDISVFIANFLGR